MRTKTVDGLRDALSALVRSVPDDFTEAVAAEWAARAKRHAADRKLETALSAPNAILRKFLRTYFKLRCGESIVHGVELRVCCTPHHSCADPDKRVQVLFKAVERARKMLEASRQA